MATDCRPKTEKIKDKLALNFKGVNFRTLGRTIRFNTEELTDEQLQNLAVISAHSCCEMKVKRSGTGLLIVVNV